MSADVIATLTQILSDVQNNRNSLASQVDTQKQQVEIGVAQLAKFDTLIAALQTVIVDEQALENIVVQQAANTVAGTAPVVPPPGTPNAMSDAGSPTGAAAPAEAPAALPSETPATAAA